MLTSTELESIAKDHRHVLEPDPEETNTSHDTYPNLPEHKLNQLHTEILHAQSEIDKLKERLNRLEKRLLTQEKKVDNEIKAMQQKILALEDLIQKHLDQH